MGWFKHLSKFLPNTFIKSDPMNDKLDRIAASFDYLPDPRESGEKGFAGALAVGGATKPEHATTAGQAVNRTFNTGLDSGTANNYEITIPIDITSYTDGLEIWFKPVNNCTGASQVKVNGIGYVPLKKANGQNLSDDDLTTSNYAGFRFNGTELRAIGALPGDADQAALSRQSADESKQWAIGVPTEPAGHSAKYWAQQAPNAETLGGYPLDHTGVPLIRGYRADGKIYNDNSDLNGIEINSVHNFDGVNTPNSPDSNWGFVTTYIHGNYSSSNAWRSQLSVGMQTHDIYHRYGNPDGSWQSWAKFITDSNFNTYGNARYLRLVGGTMSGNVDMGGFYLKSNTYKLIGCPGPLYSVVVGDVSRELAFRSSARFDFDGPGNLDGIYFNIAGVGTGLSNLSPKTNNDVKLGTSTLAYKEVNSYSYVTASDERIKDISDIGDTSWIYNLKPVSYEWKNNPSGTRYGFSAQKTYEIMPDKTANLVSKPDKEKDSWGMQPDQLIPLILNEMKILRQRIEQLEEK